MANGLSFLVMHQIKAQFNEFIQLFNHLNVLQMKTRWREDTTGTRRTVRWSGWFTASLSEKTNASQFQHVLLPRSLIDFLWFKENVASLSNIAEIQMAPAGLDVVVPGPGKLLPQLSLRGNLVLGSWREKNRSESELRYWTELSGLNNWVNCWCVCIQQHLALERISFGLFFLYLGYLSCFE
jgi:hypothetical protein